MTQIVPQDFVRLSGTPHQIIDTLGPLAELSGSWVGSKGWNIIAVPAPGSTPNDEGQFLLLVRPYTETINFTPVGAPVRNRGGSVDQFVGALEYDLRINDLETGEVLHVENGLWMYLGNVVNNSGVGDAPDPTLTIARSASIPHGDSALILGDATVTPGGPAIPAIDSRPPDIGPDSPLGYLEPYILDQPIDVVNPNSVLQQAIAGQDIISTTTLVLDSEDQGGINNIPFIVRHADAARFQCAFWIETVRISPTQTIQQLQYSQVIDLEFHRKFGGAPGLITWPHVNVNTLVKQ